MEHITRVGEGLEGVPEPPEGTERGQVRTLCLHGNAIARVGAGLRGYAGLAELNLSSNRLERVDGLAGLAGLRSLNLASNRLAAVEGLGGLKALVALNLAHNRVASLVGFRDLWGGPLAALDLRGNLVASVTDLDNLEGLPGLRTLDLADSQWTNPACALPGYREKTLQTLPQVRELDGRAAAGAAAGGGVASPRPPPAPLAPGPSEPERTATPAEAVPGPGGAAEAGVGPDAMAVVKKLDLIEASVVQLIERSGRAASKEEEEGLAAAAGRRRDEVATQTSLDSEAVRALELEATKLQDSFARLVEDQERKGRAFADERRAYQEAAAKASAETLEKFGSQIKLLRTQKEELSGALVRSQGRVSELLAELQSAGKVTEAAVQKFETEHTLKEKFENDRKAADQRYTRTLSLLAISKSEQAKMQEDVQAKAGRVAALEEDVRELKTQNRKLAAKAETAEIEMMGIAMKLQREHAAEMLAFEKALAKKDSEGVKAQAREEALAAEVAGLGDKIRVLQTEAELKLQEVQREKVAQANEIASLQQQHHLNFERLRVANQADLDAAVRAVRLAAEKETTEAVDRSEADASATIDGLKRLAEARAGQLEAARAEWEPRIAEGQEALRLKARELEVLQGKCKEQETVMAELVQVVQKQQQQVRALRGEKEALRAEVAKNPEKIEALEKHLAEARGRLAGLKQFKVDAERLLKAAADEKAAAEKRAADSAGKAERASRELQAATQEFGDKGKQYELLLDEVKIKDTQLDDQNDSISTLKQRLKVEEEKCQYLEVESQNTIDRLESEIDILRDKTIKQEEQVHRAEDAAAQAKSRRDELQRELQGIRDDIEGKDEMIQYVQVEVENVQKMFYEKEAKLKEEVEAALKERDGAVEKSDKVQVALEDVAQKFRDMEVAKKVEEKKSLSLGTMLAAKELDLRKSHGKVKEVEAEMRVLLTHMEHQKSVEAK